VESDGIMVLYAGACWAVIVRLSTVEGGGLILTVSLILVLFNTV